MSEQKNHTPDDLPEEIETNRLIFKRDAEKKIYVAVSNALEDIFKDNACDSRPTENNGSSLSDNGKDEKSRTKIELLPSPMVWIIFAYVAIVTSVLFSMLRYWDWHISNNECIVLVTILILATIVLILAGRFCVVVMQLQHEKEQNDKKDEKKRSDPELSFKEKVLKRTQEAVLDKVVEDTIRSFDK